MMMNCHFLSTIMDDKKLDSKKTGSEKKKE